MPKMEVKGEALIVHLNAIFPGWDFPNQRHEVAAQLRVIADELDSEEGMAEYERTKALTSFSEGWYGWFNWQRKTKRQRTSFQIYKGWERKFSD